MSNQNPYIIVRDFRSGTSPTVYGIQTISPTGFAGFQKESVTWTHDPSRATRFADPNMAAAFCQRCIDRDSSLKSRLLGMQLKLILPSDDELEYPSDTYDDYDRAMRGI